jgi:hypothetical protein
MVYAHFPYVIKIMNTINCMMLVHYKIPNLDSSLPSWFTLRSLDCRLGQERLSMRGEIVSIGGMASLLYRCRYSVKVTMTRV